MPKKFKKKWNPCKIAKNVGKFCIISMFATRLWARLTFVCEGHLRSFVGKTYVHEWKSLIADYRSPPFLFVVIFSCRRKEHVTAGIECCLNTVLDDTNDEADSNSLHGDIIADAQKRTSHRNEQ